MTTSKIYSIKNSFENSKNIIKNNLGYEFIDSKLLLTAITHSSLKSESEFNINYDNEKLEFIGDAVLDLIISNFLLSDKSYSNSEGTLTINRSKLVNESSLSYLAKKIGLQNVLLLSNSARKIKIQNHSSVLADAFEALVGAIFLDSTFETCEKIIIKIFIEELDNLFNQKNQNFKGMLNELMVKEDLKFPEYEVIKIEGPDHNRTYTVKLEFGDLTFIGRGSSIKDGEQNAAMKAYNHLKVNKNV